MNNGNRLLQHPLALSRGIYPSASGQRDADMSDEVSQGINPQAESESSLKAAIAQ